VAILDADKEGFLRSTRSLIQTCGRASRNSRGKVIMYADVVTESMKLCIDETNRRRKIQQAYNRAHNITPETIQKDITQVFDFGDQQADPKKDRVAEAVAEYRSLEDLEDVINSLKKEMNQAAKALEFERAAEIRDEIKLLQKLIVLEA
jgi:excinuclease ABC subunit B